MERTETFIVSGLKKHLQMRDYKGAENFVSNHLGHHKDEIDMLSVVFKNGYVLFEYTNNYNPKHPFSFTDTVTYAYDGYVVVKMMGDYDDIYKDIMIYYLGVFIGIVLWLIFVRYLYINIKRNEEMKSLIREKKNLSNIVEQLNNEIIVRKEVEKELVNERKHFAILLKSINDAIISVSHDYLIKSVNPAGCKLIGLCNEDVLNKYVFDVMRFYDENEKRNLNKDDMFKDYPVVIRDGLKLFLDYKKSIYVECSVYPFNNEGELDDEILEGWVMVVRDISDRKRIEEEIIRLQKIETIKLVAGGIAHDFNNILAGIRGNLSLLSYKICERNRKYMENIEKAVERAKGIIDQLIYFSRDEDVSFDIINIKEIIEESVSFILMGSGIEVLYKFDDNLWYGKINKTHFSQIIQNIVINAREVMNNKGKIIIVCDNVAISKSDIIKEGEYIKIEIKDNGPGIPQEVLDKIFEPFASTKNRGSGLGLAIVKSIIEKYDGYIYVDSEIGRGTVFTIFLPATKDKENGENIKFDNIEKGEGKIIVMDDEKLVRDMAVEMVSYLGYKCKGVSSGDELISMYEECLKKGERIDAVIVDMIVKTGKGGKEVVDYMRNKGYDVKIIISTAYSEEKIKDIKDKIDGVLSKPYGIEEMSRLLRRVIN